ncbi:F0F1 ATP synthase subunit delta [Allofrancisella guangzhouensis]|uniref:ATP synthase subunit delta n=1 Tax=Allofrancisella guangzhouensis TaxID=594679 RepID=A0A0A8E246_9GAMM|nr:F0F1 ATP synthase subunit delta [Allofrancisella guangzhouensis]AJC48285.1 ATP synthase F0F1 subunit delta [Allofrancisella guangzhouensis]MBK2026629.1 F0F1 ATP synthase subunit delta [Allofrancisella guangzhouensis]MBK2043796.1 F0F1 ATP synthase subunit delta [Allofrancisella guangzhouensis]MBK2045616.1 F0F1 ATP synthase subunit delta [Allofrancisella guangzhouensis]
MADLSVIAKPYAKAVFEFANENSLSQEWSMLLKTFAKLIEDNSVQSIITSPIFSQPEIIEVLKDQLNEKFYNFLALLAQNKKLTLLPLISDQFELFTNTQNNSKVAKVTLAYSADKDLLDSLKASLERKFGCSMNLEVEINPAIVGGAIVRVGDTVIDNSVSGRLEKLKSILLS